MPDAVALKNPIKELFKADKTALGMLVRLARSGDIARIAKTTGHDFIFIDYQHSLFSTETIGHIAQAAMGCGVAPLVRVRRYDDPDTSVLLDNGVAGIVFPDIANAEQARQAVDRAKFAPVGRRSVAGSFTMFDFRAIPAPEALAALNDYTLVVCMIEDAEGLENIEEIAAVDGIDVIHVGSSDLLVAIGKPGAYGCPEHIAALDRVISVTKAHGKIPGLGGDRNAARQADFIRKGGRFVTTNADIAFLMSEAGRYTTELRKAIG